MEKTVHLIEHRLAVNLQGTSNGSYLLKILMETAQKNVDKKKQGKRYEEELKLFSVYLFIIGGRILYEFLQANLSDSLPSITEAERILTQTLLLKELKNFLVSHNLPVKVCISENGTRIQQKFLYDQTTNQIIGPVLPLANKGVTITCSFPAISAAAIAAHLKRSNLSSSAYAFMAQPLRKGAPSFCLCLFGTDNRFSAQHTFRRWSFIREELSKLGVEVECFSADGDPKTLNAMHSLLFSSNTNYKEQWKDWFYAETESNFTVIQDPTHTINKFRIRLNPSNILQLGNFSVSITHIRLLIKEESREKHGSTDQDLNNEDKMNFNSSFKICTSRVTELMATSVPGNNATVAYLTNIRFVLEACLDDGLSAAERLYRVWHCAFFLRFWKLWLKNHKSYTMENFVTANLYVCIEIIAYALTIILMKFRDNLSPQFYLPSLFSSQACESFFRLARSMTSTESTVINFSMKEFLSKVRRVDMLHHCVSKLSDKLEFPRDKRKKLLGSLHEQKHQGTYLPNDAEILDIVITARSDAVLSLGKLGVNYSPTTSMVAIQNYLSSVKSFEEGNESSTDNIAPLCTDNFTEDDIPLDILAAFPSASDIPCLEPISDTDAEAEEIFPPHSMYTVVPKSGGGFVKLRKSTFCWLIANNGLKLSSDRLQRVRQSVCTSITNIRYNCNVQVSEPFVCRKEEIQAGDWCVLCV
ncbi:Endopolyphosphatase [Frankliniella fusca]|uniref:Endopolyphosphatase n=1 Tax=Frankliniella fusca TaxID=407009 RepID=A0AAE1HS40_9NEOP|nr:Endopolyphosphatase [Frankliniella fusca]